MLTWDQWSDEVWHGLDGAGVTIAEVRLAAEGEADGSLGAFARFMLAARGISDRATPPSAAGWYWTGTTDAIGIWTRPAGPFATPEDAIRAVEAADWSGMVSARGW